jgi:hypothetical protein
MSFANADAGLEQFFLISEDDLAPVPELNYGPDARPVGVSSSGWIDASSSGPWLVSSRRRSPPRRSGRGRSGGLVT